MEISKQKSLITPNDDDVYDDDDDDDDVHNDDVHNDDGDDKLGRRRLTTNCP